MGGPGSGYRWDKVTTVEETQRIDIRYLRKNGLLGAFRRGSLRWNRGGESTDSIAYLMYPDRMELDFKYKQFGGEWQPIRQTIDFDRTACNFGGERKWFLCPQCRRRVAVLCLAGSCFLCRKCYRLPYGSQNEDYLGRVIRRRNKLKDRLFEDDYGYRRRKGLHRETFDRLFGEYVELDSYIEQAIDRMLNGGYRPAE